MRRRSLKTNLRDFVIFETNSPQRSPGSSAHRLAASAIRGSSVETVPGTRSRSSFPAAAPCTGAPVPPRGPLGCVPPLPRYYEALRLPDTPGATLRLLRMALPRLTRPSLPGEARGPSPRSLEFLPVSPSGPLRGSVWASQVPGGPSVHVPPSLTPVRLGARPFSAPRCCLPLTSRRRLLTSRLFRGSITRPAHSLSKLRSPGHPGTTQDSLPAGGLLYRAGFAPAGPFVRFPPPSLPPHPGFAWRTTSTSEASPSPSSGCRCRRLHLKNVCTRNTPLVDVYK